MGLGGNWDRDFLWKFYGYMGGPHVLDEVMGVRSNVRPAGLHEVEKFLSEEARAVLRRQLLLAAHSLRAADPQTARLLLAEPLAPPAIIENRFYREWLSQPCPLRPPPC